MPLSRRLKSLLVLCLLLLPVCSGALQAHVSCKQRESKGAACCYKALRPCCCASTGSGINARMQCGCTLGVPHSKSDSHTVPAVRAVFVLALPLLSDSVPVLSCLQVPLPACDDHKPPSSRGSPTAPRAPPLPFQL